MNFSKELRSGNWVEVAGQYYTVNGQFLAEVEKSNCTWKKDVKPIILTPEILLACGFKYQDRDTNRKEPTRFYISPNFGDHREYWLEMNFPFFEGHRFFWWLNWDIGGGLRFVHLPHGEKLIHLHQLQNFWFSNEFKELEISAEKLCATVQT